MKLIRKQVAIAILITMIMTIFPSDAIKILAAVNTAEINLNVDKKAEPKIVGEIKEKREANIKHFFKDDLSFEAAVYPYPVHYKLNGKWEDIDNSLSEGRDENNNEILENKANEIKVKISKNTKSNKIISVKKENYEVSWDFIRREQISASEEKKLIYDEPYYNIDRNEKLNEVFAQVRAKNFNKAESLSENEKKKVLNNISSTIDFTNIYQDIDLQYELKGNQVKENIIINKKMEAMEFEFNLDLKNVIPKQKEDNSIVFYDDKDDSKVVFKMDAPFMYDAKDEKSNNIKVSLKEEHQKYVLVITPDDKWLNESDRTYPVTIDPPISTSLDARNIFDSYVSSKNPDSNYYLLQHLGVGYGYNSGDYTRTYIKFNLPNLTSAELVTEAYLDLFLNSDNRNNIQINAHRIKSSWESSAITWNNQPTFDSKIEDYQIVNGVGGSSVSWNITNAAKDWYNTGNNLGLMLKNNNESQIYSQFLSSDCSLEYQYLRPSITLSYVSNSGLESYWTYRSQDIGRSGTGYINNYNGNLVYTHNDISMSGSRTPVNISHVYNSNKLDQWDKKGAWLGRGWTLNILQRIDKVPMQGINYFAYIDEDGTKHYFQDTGASQLTDELNQGFTLVKESDGKFSVRDKSDNKVLFLSDGRFDMIVDSNGNTLKAGYSNSVYYNAPIITTITDGSNRVTNLLYDNSGLLYGIKDPAGRTTYFDFDQESWQMLKQIRYPDGKYTKFDYDSNYNLIGVSRWDGYKITYEYTTTNPYRVRRTYESNGTTLGNEMNISYGNNSTAFVDVKGRKTIYHFNSFGSATSITGNDGSAQYYNYIEDQNNINKNKLATESKLQKTTVNFIRNHNFESSYDWGAASWGNNTGTQEFTTEQKYMGYRSLKITSTSDQGGRDYEQTGIVAEKGKSYTFSGYVKTIGVPVKDNAGASLFIGYLDSSGTSQFIRTYINGTRDWNRYEVNFTLPLDAQSNNIWVAASMLNSTGTAYFDCLQLEEGHIANRYNLIENSSFTYGGDTPDYWIKNSQSNIYDKAVTTEAAPYPVSLGSRSFKITGDATKQKALTQWLTIPGNKGDALVLAGWLKGDSVPTGSGKSFSLSVGFELYNGAYEWYGIDMPNSVTDWQYVSRRVVPQNDYKNIVYYAIYYNNVNNAYFDGMQLYKEEFGTSFQYDSKGNVTTTSELDRQSSTFQYSVNNDLTKSIDPKGNSFTYEYDNGDTSKKNHNLTKATSAQNVVYSFTYDSYGNPKTSRIGDSITFIQSEATYTTDGNYIETLKDSSGNTTVYKNNTTKGLLESVEDPNKKITSYAYDNNSDQLTSVSKVADNKTITNSYQYENDRLKTINHNGFGYNFIYDSLGNIKEINVSGQKLINNVYEARSSLLTDSTYGNGQKISNIYDSQDRVISKKYNDIESYKYEYDASGNLGYHRDLINNVDYRYIYDLSDRLTQVTDSRGNSTKYQYDLNNNISSIRQYFNGVYPTNLILFPAQNISNLATGKTGTSSSNESYDKSANMAFDNNTSTRWSSSYADNQWLYVDLGGVKYIDRVVLNWETAYGKSYSIQVSDDAVNWKTVYSETNGDGGTDDILGLSTKGRYVKMLGLQRGTQYGFSLWEFKVYEGKPVVSSSNENNSLSGGQAFDNNSLTRWASKSSDNEWIYVDLGSTKEINRVVLNWETAYAQSYDIQVSNDAVNWSTVYSTDTGNGGITEIGGLNVSGRYVKMNGRKRGTQYGYSLFEFSVYQEDADTTNYEYDKDNRQTKVKWGKNQSITYGYDNLGRSTGSIINTSTSVPYSIQYNYETGYNGSSTNRISSIKYNNNASSMISYTYDTNGNVSNVTQNGNNIKYYYDELNELTREDNQLLNKTITYTYDAGGNLTIKREYPYTTGTPGTATRVYNYSYGDTNWKDKLTSFDNKAITYDAIGNPLTYNGYTYVWEQGRQLKSITGNSKTISYKYDDSGIRTEKTVNGVVTKYYLVGDKVTYEESGADKVYYTYDSAGSLVSMNLNGVEYYYIRNVQGDIIGLFDKNGATVASYTYDSWGKLISIKDGSGTDITNNTASVGYKNPYRYRGYRYDTETGLYYLQSRYYNPEWGRFINADGYGGKIGDLLSHNLFAYCKNNPVNLMDPDGNFGFLAALGGIAGGSAILAVATVAIVAVAAVAVVALVATAITEAVNHHEAAQLMSNASSSSSGTTSSSSSSGGGGGGNPSSPNNNGKKPKKTTHGHHTYIKALGGAAAQKLVEVAPELHKKVHAALYQFEGGWLAPKRGYTGKMIQDLFSAKNIQNGLMRFYNSNEEFHIFIDPLKEAIKFTGK